MKVKVGDQVFDPNDVPIMVILEKGDRERICDMLSTLSKYAAYPDDYFESDEEARAWMKRGLSDGKEGKI